MVTPIEPFTRPFEKSNAAQDESFGRTDALSREIVEAGADFVRATVLTRPAHTYINSLVYSHPPQNHKMMAHGKLFDPRQCETRQYRRMASSSQDPNGLNQVKFRCDRMAGTWERNGPNTPH